MRASLVHLCAALCLLSIACDPDGPETAGPQRTCQHYFFFQADRDPAGELLRPSEVALVGDFNHWNKDRHPLREINRQGLYAAAVTLPPGMHLYRLWLGDHTRLDRFNPLTHFAWNDRESSVIFVDDCQRPALQVDHLHASPAGSLEATVSFVSGSGGAALDPAAITLTLHRDQQPLPPPAYSVSGHRIAISATGLAPGKLGLRIHATDRNGRQAEPLLLPFWVEEAPFAWDDALIYQVVVDRFRRGDGQALRDDVSISFFRGGDLWGVHAALEEGYFDALGANTLWLSPLYTNPEGAFIGRDGHLAEGYHGYWAIAPRSVDPRFGGEEALDALVAAAHARGIRVIVDLVLNHLHEQHPYFQAQPDATWFNHPKGDCICGMSCPWHLHMLDCWFDPFLPDLQWRNPAVGEQMIADALWWLERFDLDGLRLDAVPMMPRLAMRHLRHRVTQRFDQGGQHTYLLGETYTMQGEQAVIGHYVGPEALSGQFDFPVMWLLRAALTHAASWRALDEEVLASERTWAQAGATMAPIIGNHDVPRIISALNGDPLWQPRENPPPQPQDPTVFQRLLLAWTFLLTQAGAPVIYYGDEIGLAGAYDPDNRRNMHFSELSDLQGQTLAAVQRLGQVRRCSVALRRGERTTLLVGNDLYAYARAVEAGPFAIVILNRANSEQSLRLSLPRRWDFGPAGPKELFGADAQQIGTDLVLTLPPLGAAVLLQEGHCVPASPARP